MQAMNEVKKYPWIKMVIGYSIICPAFAGFCFLLLHILSSLIFTSITALVLTPLYAVGGIAFFGIPYLIFALFFIGFKVHKGWHAYGLAAIWGSFLGLFMFFGLKPPYAISNVEAQAGWMAALSLALAGVLVTYWVVPPKVVEADGIPPNQ